MSYLHLFAAFTHHIEAIVIQGGYAVLFITTILEGVPLLGMAIPGHITIIIAGFMAKIGVLDIRWVFVLSVVGAVLGDCLGFIIGRKYGMSFIDRLRPYFFITNAHIDRARALIERHTGKALIMGRFSPVTRALMPFLVGTSRAPTGTFWFFNIIGGISWAVVSVCIGYIFGASYHVAAPYIGKLVIFAILLAILIIWGYRFVNMRFHIFKRYELFTLGLHVFFLWVLFEMIQDACSATSFMAGLDVQVNLLVQAFTEVHHSAISIATFVSAIGSLYVTLGLGIIISLALLYRRKWRSAAILLLSLGGTTFLLGILKEFFLRDRPANALIAYVDPSFPSAHAACAAAFFVIVAYLVVRNLHTWLQRELVILAAVLAVLAIGISRIVLNVHWTSDVFAGWALGVCVATGSILFVRYIGALIVGSNK